MLPDRVSNPGPLTYKSGALPIALRGPANGYTYKGSNSTIFASLLSRGQLLKQIICSSRSKFFPLRVDPHVIKIEEKNFYEN